VAQRPNRLDFGGDPDQGLDSGFLNPDQDSDLEKNSFIAAYKSLCYKFL